MSLPQNSSTCAVGALSPPGGSGCAGEEKSNCKNEIFLTVFPDRFAARR